MSGQLIAAIIMMYAALAFYSIGVWSERFAGRLRTWHLVMFWVGLVFDTTGTSIMAEMAGGMNFDFHGVTGGLAIALMLGHAVWATIVLIKKQERWIHRFHKLSVFVWLVWLIPFISGQIGQGR